MIWLRRARLRRTRRVAEWAVVIVLGLFTLFLWFCIGALLNYAFGMSVQQAPAAQQVAYWRAGTAHALIENVPFITAEIPAAPPLIAVHGEFNWIMRDRATAWCCDERDCRELGDGEVAQRSGQWHVNGHPVEHRAVYPSQHKKNAAFVACFRGPDLIVPRCLFLPLNG